MQTFKATFKLLSLRERWQLGFILLFMLPNALMQVAGVASIMPFIAVLSQPDLIHQNPLLASAYLAVGEPPPQQFLALLAGAALCLLVVANALAAFTAWLILRYTYMRVHTLSYQLLKSYVTRPYDFFLQRNPSELAKNVITEVNQLVTGFIMPFLRLVAQGAVAVAILTLLLIINPLIAISVGLLLGGAYAAIYWFFRGRITRFGERRFEANRLRFKATHEVLGAIKDLKVSGRDASYLEAYANASHAFAHNQANHSLITELPRYALESVAFGIVLSIALYLVVTGQSMQSALPMIALYAMAGYRLMPALQQIYDNATAIRFAAPAVAKISAEMADPPSVPADGDLGAAPPINLNEQLVLKDINYRYAGMDRWVLDRVSVVIEARTTVAFVGASGAGKSTLVDIILGLLSPSAGYLALDSTKLTSANLGQWRSRLGYVPQTIYLADDTLRKNIALGVPECDIDDNAVMEAARAAAIHNFIIEDLPMGYDTIAGDRGVRLSGGQRQRIGIARALYHNPSVLILDEATSALDGSTEQAVMDAIERLSGAMTIIIIAHRLTTVRYCDCLHLLERGKLIGSGSYDELVQSQPIFTAMAAKADVPSAKALASAGSRAGA